MGDALKAPWTPEQVENLNRFQGEGRFHPFTCGNDRTDEAHTRYQAEHGGDFGQLVATPEGWVCPVCDYRQDWAHPFMAEVVETYEVAESGDHSHHFPSDWAWDDPRRDEVARRYDAVALKSGKFGVYNAATRFWLGSFDTMRQAAHVAQSLADEEVEK